MPIPEYEAIKLPALTYLLDGHARPIREVYAELAKVYALTDAEQNELLPSGTQRRWHNRVNWACYDLYRAGLLSRPKRGIYQINDLGRSVAAQKPQSLDRNFLKQFPNFAEWAKPSADRKPDTQIENIPIVSTPQTANERLDTAFRELQIALKEDVLDQVRAMDPFKFEQLVVDLLVAMGYGGSRAEAASVTQRSGDEGIDGVIKEDRLGLDVIYIQAKRWQNTWEERSSKLLLAHSQAKVHQKEYSSPAVSLLPRHATMSIRSQTKSCSLMGTVWPNC
jgi:restriction system protein